MLWFVSWCCTAVWLLASPFLVARLCSVSSVCSVFFSELHSPGRSLYANYWYSWVQTIYYLLKLPLPFTKTALLYCAFQWYVKSAQLAVTCLAVINYFRKQKGLKGHVFGLWLADFNPFCFFFSRFLGSCRNYDCWQSKAQSLGKFGTSRVIERRSKKKLKVSIKYVILKLRQKRPTYLFYFHYLEISRSESIVSIALVTAKILIYAHFHIYWVLCSRNAAYLTAIRFIPGECRCRNTIWHTLQRHCLTNPRLISWWSDFFYCRRI